MFDCPGSGYFEPRDTCTRALVPVPALCFSLRNIPILRRRGTWTQSAWDSGPARNSCQRYGCGTYRTRFRFGGRKMCARKRFWSGPLVCVDTGGLTGPCDLKESSTQRRVLAKLRVRMMPSTLKLVKLVRRLDWMGDSVRLTVGF
jgi:hypothetical protein